MCVGVCVCVGVLTCYSELIHAYLPVSQYLIAQQMEGGPHLWLEPTSVSKVASLVSSVINKQKSPFKVLVWFTCVFFITLTIHNMYL